MMSDTFCDFLSSIVRKIRNETYSYGCFLSGTLIGRLGVAMGVRWQLLKASPRIDMCKAPQQRAGMNMSYSAYCFSAS